MSPKAAAGAQLGSMSASRRGEPLPRIISTPPGALHCHWEVSPRHPNRPQSRKGGHWLHPPSCEVFGIVDVVLLHGDVVEDLFLDPCEEPLERCMRDVEVTVLRHLGIAVH
eukprot:6465846-Amphidinium_carterae.1